MRVSLVAFPSIGWSQFNRRRQLVASGKLRALNHVYGQSVMRLRHSLSLPNVHSHPYQNFLHFPIHIRWCLQIMREKDRARPPNASTCRRAGQMQPHRQCIRHFPKASRHARWNSKARSDVDEVAEPYCTCSPHVICNRRRVCQHGELPLLSIMLPLYHSP